VLEQQVKADLAFHQAIAEAAHNVMFGHLTASLFRVINDHIDRNLRHLRRTEDDWMELRDQHARSGRASAAAIRPGLGGGAPAHRFCQRKHGGGPTKSRRPAPGGPQPGRSAPLKGEAAEVESGSQ
jgi:hypothetical protein